MKTLILFSTFVFLWAAKGNAERIYACNPYAYVSSKLQSGNAFILKGNEELYTYIDDGSEIILKYITDGLWYKIYLDVRKDRTNRAAYYIYDHIPEQLEIRRMNWDVDQIQETLCFLQ